MEKNEKVFMIPEDVLQAVFVYLQNRPWKEVTMLVDSLRKSVQEFKVDEVVNNELKEDDEENTDVDS